MKQLNCKKKTVMIDSTHNILALHLMAKHSLYRSDGVTKDIHDRHFLHSSGVDKLDLAWSWSKIVFPKRYFIVDVVDTVSVLPVLQLLPPRSPRQAVGDLHGPSEAHGG